MNCIHFTVPGQPIPKARARRGRSGRWYTPARTRVYEERVGWEAWLAGARPVTGDVEVRIVVRGKTRRRKFDLDNIAKAILDGLTGVAYYDDAQVVALEVRWESGEPSAEVAICRPEIRGGEG